MTKPAGRPHNLNRQAALVVGDKTYAGKRCKRCGSTLRYTRGSGCVDCQKTNAIEARQLLRAARRGVKPNSDDLDFLGEEQNESRAHVRSRRAHVPDPSCSVKLTNSRVFTSREELISENESGGENDINNINIENGGGVKTHVEREHVSKPETDPEPLCPQCGCGVEADYEGRDGWLVRTSEWRCTICDWVSDDVPAAPKLGGESLDNDDWLG